VRKENGCKTMGTVECGAMIRERQVTVRPGACGKHCERCEQARDACTTNDTELEKLKKRLQFVLYCKDGFLS
jgi:hypothetical protein